MTKDGGRCAAESRTLARRHSILSSRLCVSFSSQEEAALEAMPDLDDWEEPRAVTNHQSTKRLRVVSQGHVDEEQGLEEDLMMLEDGQGADKAPTQGALTVTGGDEDGVAMEDELLALMTSGAAENAQGEAGQKKRRVLVDSDDDDS